MIQDENNNVYKAGLKLDYSPVQIDFPEDFNKDDIQQISCGRRHYVMVNKHNQLFVWGNVFKEKPVKEH